MDSVNTAKIVRKKPYILGIDPGISGALCVLSPSENEIIKVWDFPLCPHGAGGKNIIDVHILAVDIEAFAPSIAIAILEDVHSMPGNGGVHSFTFGVSKGIVIGMLAAFKIPTFATPPAVWKSVYGLSKDKNASRALASLKYPGHAHKWTRKKDDGRAESVLLAEFGKRFY